MKGWSVYILATRVLFYGRLQSDSLPNKLEASKLAGQANTPKFRQRADPAAGLFCTTHWLPWDNSPSLAY